MFNTVIISTNENRGYYEHLPLVVAAWKRFFPNCKVKLAYITNKLENNGLYNLFSQVADEVKMYVEVAGVHSANFAKVSRYLYASEQGDDVCIIHDIDTIPLQAAYWEKLFNAFDREKLFCVGHDVYEGSEHEGKFPASSMMGTGHIFKTLINPNQLDFTSLFQGLAMRRVFDDKENIINHPTMFSDESLIRALISINNVPITKVNRGINTDTQWIDRSSWKTISESDLKYGSYVECNLPRSHEVYDIKPYVDKIEDFIFSDNNHFRYISSKLKQWNTSQES